MRMSLDEIISATGGRLLTPDTRHLTPVISGVSTDSRTLRAGDLFVPLRGPRADGHDFITDAVRRGAAAALCARSVDGLPPRTVLIRVDDPLRALGRLARAYRRTLTVTVVGVTGSVGKTTTTQLCAAVLAGRFTVAATREDWNAEIGVPLTLLGLTPHHQVVVIEMAMRGPGQIAELVEIAAPSIGVVTSIGESHMEMLGSRENIALAKGELIAGLPPDGVAVLNRDDGLVVRLARLCRGRVITYGLAEPADVTASDVRFEPEGMAFHLVAAGTRTAVRLPVWGRHNVANALAAAAVGLALGMDAEMIAAGTASWSPPKMRLQPIRLGEILVINDAYNSSPTSMRAALDVLEEVGRGRRRIAVLGEMRELGPRSPDLHRAVGGDVARRQLASLLTVGQGAEAIGDGAAAGGMARDRIEHIATVEEAAGRLRALLRGGDVVLIKGSRALHMEDIVGALHPSPNSRVTNHRGSRP